MKYIYKFYEINRLVYTGDGRMVLRVVQATTFFQTAQQSLQASASMNWLISPTFCKSHCCVKKWKWVSLIKVKIGTVCSHEYRNNSWFFKKSIIMKLYSNFTSRDIFKGARKLKRRNQEEKSLSSRKYCLQIN